MTDAPNPKTIDFAKVFSGQEYPKDSVSVIVDENLGYKVNQVQKKIRVAVLSGDADERKALEAEYDDLAKSAKDATYTFYLTGIPRELKEDLTRTVREEFNIETDMFGNAKFNEDAEKAYKSRRWALHIEKIEGPDGSVAVAPTAENLAAFLASAPDTAIETVDAKIAELSGSGAAEGFDLLIRDADFLS